MNAAPNLPAVIAGRYQPVRLIAKGGMGAVYEVEHARTGERLALKVLLSGLGASAEDLERFKREARAPARIKSDHVVRVTDADVAPELDGAPFLVMELLEGTDLERQAAAARPDATTVIGWLRQVATAIDKAHRLGIVHRDLKPENLFLTTSEDRAPIIKVLDFGISKLTEDGTGATASGQIVGTPRYMAPEQASSGARVTPATDLFALGLVAYRLLAGESYFRGDPINVLAQLLHEPMRPPSERQPELGKAFDAWFARACHRNPEQRFGSAAEQVEALSAALGLPTLPVTPSGVRHPSGSALTTDRTTSARRRPLFAVAAVLVAGAVVGGVLVTRRTEPTETHAPNTSSVFPPPAAQAPPRPAGQAPPPPAAEAPPPVAPPAAAMPPPAPAPHAPTPHAKPRDKADLAIAREHAPPKPAPPADPYADQK
jgi:serine/threonine-protein kinase